MTADTAIDAALLRRVFGAFPSGIVAVAALGDAGPIGIAASSFTSVSLSPPIVSVNIAHSSTTLPQLRRAPRWGVSVLAEDQQVLGRQLAARGTDRFAGVDWRSDADGAVHLTGAAAWFTVGVHSYVRAGDHDIVLLDVEHLDIDADAAPLVFHASRFRRLQPPSE